MKKLTLILGLAVMGTAAMAQSVEDLARESQCNAIEMEMKPLLKAKDHPKKGLKSSTWSRLADSYVNSANSCKKDTMAANKALEAYQKALELEGPDGKNVDAIKEKLTGEALGNAFMNQGVYYYNANNLSKAAEDFLQSMNINETDTLAAFYAGIAAQQSQNKAAATKALTAYIERGGVDVVAFYTLASTAQEEERYDDAIAILKQAVELYPNDREIKGTLINVYLTAEKLDEAIVDLEKLTKEDPSNVTNFVNLGILYDNKDDMENALKYYNIALEKDPSNFDANFNLGVFEFNKGVEMKHKVDEMDMETYRKEGKQVEKEVCTQFRVAKKYFDAANASKPGDADVTNNLTSIGNVLSQCD